MLPSLSHDQAADQAVPSVVVAGIILAAGKGTRMRSALPKVLHPIMGRPMVDWVLRSLACAGVQHSIMVLGAEHAPFEGFLRENPSLILAIQSDQRGTADAVASAQGAFTGVTKVPYAQSRLLRGTPVNATHVLICAGDTPALRAEELTRFVKEQGDADIAVLGMQPEDPKGYGRLILKNGSLTGIVEERDADSETKKIPTVNSGVILARKAVLFDLLSLVTPNNAQGEYYLTDIIRLGYEKGYRTRAHIAEEAREFSGVNDRTQLAALEQWMLGRTRDAAMAKGVSLHMPETIYIESDVEIGEDTDLSPGVKIYGKSKLGRACRVGAGACLRDVVVGDGAVIGEGSVLTGVAVKREEIVPPLTRLV